jgi:hypothetical protein
MKERHAGLNRNDRSHRFRVTASCRARITAEVRWASSCDEQRSASAPVMQVRISWRGNQRFDAELDDR